MKESLNPSPNAFQHKRQVQDTKKEALKRFIVSQPYIDITDQPAICKSFGLPFLRNVFRNEYRKRFYAYLFNNTTTCATAARATGIPQKFLTCCKLYYEKRDLLKVVGIDVCPVTQSRNVQFLSTNPKEW